MNSEQTTDYFGLTTTQIENLLEDPFAHDELVLLSSEAVPPVDVPVVVALDALNEAIDTCYWIPKGDETRLHPGVTSHIIDQLMDRIDLQHCTPAGGDSRVYAMLHLYVILDLLESAGIFRSGAEYYILADQWEKEIHAHDYRRVFPLLFKTYTRDLDWESWQPRTHEPVQPYAILSLMLLASIGDSVQDLFWATGEFFPAFPELAAKLTVDPEMDEVECHLGHFCVHYFWRYWVFMGLVDVHPTETRVNAGLRDPFPSFSASSLFSDLITFPSLQETSSPL